MKVKLSSPMGVDAAFSAAVHSVFIHWQSTLPDYTITQMQTIHWQQRESMELIDGLFWGFSPEWGLDVVSFLRHESKSKKLTIRHDSSPYAAECLLQFRKYRVKQQCSYDNRTFTDEAFPDGLYDDDFDLNSIHRSQHILCSGVVNLCGGDNLAGIVPCYYLVVSDKMKCAIEKDNFQGCSFFEVTVCPNQTSIVNPRLSGVNVRKDIILPDNFIPSDIPNRCPSCGYEPIYCSHCVLYEKVCPACGQLLFDYRNDSDLKDNAEQESLYQIIDHVYWGTNIVPGERWNGDDLMIPIGYKDLIGYIATNRFVKFMQCHNFGPLLTVPLQVDISRCTLEQRKRILELVDC